MKSYHLNHILPRKAGLIALGCFLPFFALGIFLETKMHLGRDVAGIPFLIGVILGFYFALFYVDGVKEIQLTRESIKVDNAVISFEDIKSFKLQNGSPEFIFLKIFTKNGQNLSVGTRKRDDSELLKLYKDLKKAINKHNQKSVFQITEEVLIYDKPLGKVLGVVLIILMAFTIYNRFFTHSTTKSLGGIITMLSCGTFILLRTFGKRSNT